MNIDGTWSITTKTPMGDQKADIEFRTDGTTLTGTQGFMGGTLDIVDGSLDGNSATWSVKAKKPIPMTVTFTGEVDGDSISGQAKAGPFPPAPFAGSRT